MMLAAALAGALVMTGIAVLVAELTRKAPAPGTPTSLRLSLRSMTGPARRRALLSVLVGIAMLGVTRWPVAALAAAAAVIFVPRMTASRAARQHAAMLEGLEQWTRRLADMLAASRGLEDALEVSARTAPVVIAGPVSALARRLSARVGTEEALRAFAAEIGDPAGDRIAAALIIATGKRGGGVHGVLSALAEILARDVAARREIEADRAQHRTTIKWIVVFISGFTLFAIVNRSYSAPYGTVLGEAVLAFVALLYTVGLAWLHRLGTIPAPGRFLDQTPARIAPAGLASAGLASAGLASAGLASAGMPGGTVDPYLARGGQYLARGGLAGPARSATARLDTTLAARARWGMAPVAPASSTPVRRVWACRVQVCPVRACQARDRRVRDRRVRDRRVRERQAGVRGDGTGRAPERRARERKARARGDGIRRARPGRPTRPRRPAPSRRATCLGGAARGRVAARAGAARTRAAPGRWAPGPRVLALGDPVRRMPGRQSRARVRQIPRS